MADISEIRDEDLVLELVRRERMTSRQAAKILYGSKNNEQLAQAADQWISQNGDLFDVMNEKAVALAKNNQRFSFRLIVEETRWFCKSTNRIKPFKIKDGLATYIGMRICERHPEVRKFIRTRKAF